MASFPEDKAQSNGARSISSPKLWMLLALVIGLCSFSLCFAVGGLLFRQMRGDQSNTAATLDTTPTTQTDQLPDAQDATATRPQATPASSEASLSTPTSLVQVEPTATPHACSDNPLITSPAITSPTISALSFATQHDQAGWPIDNTVQFTLPITQIEASFSYLGMQNGLPWERVWYFNDQEMARSQGVWDVGERGDLTVYARTSDFKAGLYSLEIIVAGRPLSRRNFVIAGADLQTQQPIQVAYTDWLTDRHQLNLFDLNRNQPELLLDLARSPSWSANGKGLLFYAETDFKPGSQGMYVYNINSREPIQIDNKISFRSLAWSPTDNYIASSLNRKQSPSLFLWNLTGQKQPQIGPPGETPDWAPEGRRLVYRSCDQDGWHISTIRVVRDHFDPTSVKRLTDEDGFQPVWSWDGQRIAFVRREADNNLEIYTITPDGHDLRRLTNNPGGDIVPAWTPDNRLIFRSQRENNWGLYIMDADGGNLRLLTPTSAPKTWWQAERAAVSTNIAPIEPETVRPKIAMPAGRGLLVISNRKNPDEMTFTINNQEYKIGPYQVRNLPLPPGRHTWTASWPGKASRNGIADIVAGQVAYPTVER